MTFYEYSRKPKVAKQDAGEENGARIYLVNAFDLRNASLGMEEFTNYAIHDDFPDLIPEKEIWISHRSDKSERPYYIGEALRRMRYLAAGDSSKTAYRKALAWDKAQRVKARGRFRRTKPVDPSKIKVGGKPYSIINDGRYQAWLVDAGKVRDFFKTDFVEGGHGYVYPWIPKTEIWLEAGLDAAEYKYILLHEWIEMQLMKTENMPCDKAHRMAAKKEYEARKADGLTG